MTSRGEDKRPVAVAGERRHLEHLPPPANNCSKPLTPFSIEDILSRPPLVKRRYALCVSSSSSSSSSTSSSCSSTSCAAAEKLPSVGRGGLSGRALLAHTSPLCALEELASKTFKGLEVSVLQAAEGRDGLTLFGQRNAPKKRRKSRTAFTNHQIFELEKRFLYQKYLSPADRDQIAQQLGLTNAQVITWFQNRRAKLKRDLEEMKADVESAKAVGAVAFEKLAKLAELEKCAANGASPPGTCCGEVESASPPRENLDRGTSDHEKLPMSPSTAALSPYAGRLSSRCCSEDEDEEIDVDD